MEVELKGLKQYRELMHLPIVHLVAAFVLVYVGAEVCMLHCVLYSLTS
jgi:hypothetical protein